jgi:hypothetical protein
LKCLFVLKWLDENGGIMKIVIDPASSNHRKTVRSVNYPICRVIIILCMPSNRCSKTDMNRLFERLYLEHTTFTLLMWWLFQCFVLLSEGTWIISTVTVLLFSRKWFGLQRPVSVNQETPRGGGLDLFPKRKHTYFLYLHFNGWCEAIN